MCLGKMSPRGFALGPEKINSLQDIQIHELLQICWKIHTQLPHSAYSQQAIFGMTSARVYCYNLTVLHFLPHSFNGGHFWETYRHESCILVKLAAFQIFLFSVAQEVVRFRAISAAWCGLLWSFLLLYNN